MCGIFFLLENGEISKQRIREAFNKLEKRGPDNSTLIMENKVRIGFKRLSINDMSENANQPFSTDNISLVCNGEIYNHKVLKKKFDISTKSNSDCEVILHLYEKIGIKQTLNLLDGVFAFILYDKTKNKLYCARDRIGVRPLFYSNSKNLFAVASEAKSIENLGYNSKQLKGGNYIEKYIDSDKLEIKSFYDIPNPVIYVEKDEKIQEDMRNLLISAVKKRLMSDRPIGCLLSGGLDSSIIAALLTKYSDTKIKTFSIGFPGSTDLKYARKVAKYIGSEHFELEISYKEGLDVIEEVIYTLESFDTTTVRASVGMYLLSKYISENFEEKVILSGEGADEILCGYLYFHNSPSSQSTCDESRKLVEQLPYFDVLRADRCTASHGLELRVPFLDRDFLDFCMSLEEILENLKNLRINITKNIILERLFKIYYLKKLFGEEKRDLVMGLEEPKNPGIRI